jgi:hypothetical protein
MLENRQSLNYQTIQLLHNLKNLNFQMTKQIKNLLLIFHVEIDITYTLQIKVEFGLQVDSS